ncbi:hypothetical protein LEP1GSC036_4456 [Leptospira weilii str. 2006001853]|uniref:Uncharacterized protein n=4 Tax=Leptospiraceae TaxID=170 RepID=A0A828YYG8_9LEPT|nr:hypothetical protein LEP1GSC036_4456 [Leptospira weilii str. 2006001853]EMJ63169.1 hypothetical protein LEP1GSC051_1182 [Leptospira sp. P2653]EMN46225.1 hypothetical protein LEP1GSC086_3065 [Leptospira weilii str. LNT 1234]EMN92358.1 hypothetical protein LEP1GSC108_1145 [Leptospira weilii str. UI 13098]
MKAYLDLQNMQICKDWNVEDYLKTNERKKIPFLIRKHLNECQKCQTKILEYSKSYTIPEFFFGRPFSKQKLLWFGAELANLDDLHSPTKEKKKKIRSEMGNLKEESHISNLIQNHTKFLTFCHRYKKAIFISGYFALLIPTLQLAFQIF